MSIVNSFKVERKSLEEVSSSVLQFAVFAALEKVDFYYKKSSENLT